MCIIINLIDSCNTTTTTNNNNHSHAVTLALKRYTGTLIYCNACMTTLLKHCNNYNIYAATKLAS